MAFLEGCGRETHRRLFGAKECANTFRGGMKDLKKTNKQNKTKKTQPLTCARLSRKSSIIQNRNHLLHHAAQQLGVELAL